MHQRTKIQCFFVFLLSLTQVRAQSFVFAELNGSPSLNISGWNLSGNAYVGDTGGDTDSSPNELILTNAFNTQSGGVFYSTPIDPSVCSKWTVEFDYRIWGGNAADGLAFCFLDVPPTGFVSGGGVGIPGTANGLKVILDTWNNCGGANPELQIYAGVGYDECIPGIVKVNNVSNSLSFVRSSNYQPVKITYVNGLVTLFINNVQYLSANFPINFVGYMGFTASTGGANDQHSIRNVIIYTDQAVSDAGSDISFCTGNSVQIGSSNNTDYIYSWAPSAGLSDPNISNPTVNLVNSGTQPLTQIYTVSTSFASNPGVCPSSDQVSVTVNPNLTIDLVDSICDGETYSFNGQDLNSSGLYTANLSSLQGCDSTVNLDLTVNPVYSSFIDTTLCIGSFVQFGGQSIGTEGQHVFNLQSLSGCDSTLTINISLDSLPNIVCEDQEICFGESITLVPSGANSYSWQPNQGNLGPNGEFTISPALTTSYTLNGTDNNNCSNSIQVSVVVNPLPVLTLGANQTSACVGDSIVLTASGAQQYDWLEFQNDANTEQFLLAQESSWYHVIGTDINSCSVEDSIYILIHPNPSLTITPDQSVCFGENVLINISGADSYQWSPQGQGNQYLFTPLNSMNFSVVGTDLNNCSSVAYTNVTVHPNPVAGMDVSPLITTSDSPIIDLENTSTGQSSSILDFGDGNSVDFFDQPIQYTYPFVEGNYLLDLWVENSFGCSDSITILVQVKGDEIIYIPNAFTPDGDEFNNLFSPVFTNGFDSSNYRLSIFNRWGELLFESTQSDKGWDGTYNNRLCPIGVYTWKIRYKNPESNEYKIIVGHINLIR